MKRLLSFRKKARPSTNPTPEDPDTIYDTAMEQWWTQWTKVHKQESKQIKRFLFKYTIRETLRMTFDVLFIDLLERVLDRLYDADDSWDGAAEVVEGRRDELEVEFLKAQESWLVFLKDRERRRVEGRSQAASDPGDNADAGTGAS